MQVFMRYDFSYSNYKGTYSTGLMAVCNCHYRIILANIGGSGISSDGGIFANSYFGIAFEEKTLNLPKLSFLPSTRIDFRYVAIGDESFPLKELDDAKRVYLATDS